MFVCVACVLSSACFIYPRWLCVCISSAPMPVASQTADASLKQAISLRRNGHVRGGGAILFLRHAPLSFSGFPARL